MLTGLLRHVNGIESCGAAETPILYLLLGSFPDSIVADVLTPAWRSMFIRFVRTVNLDYCVDNGGSVCRPRKLTRHATGVARWMCRHEIINSFLLISVLLSIMRSDGKKPRDLGPGTSRQALVA